MKEKLTEQQLEAIRKINAKRGVLKDAFTDEVMAILEEKFQTNLPCFQGEHGKYDPLDAMRRDAHRELLLWVKNEIKQYKQEL